MHRLTTMVSSSIANPRRAYIRRSVISTRVRDQIAAVCDGDEERAHDRIDTRCSGNRRCDWNQVIGTSSAAITQDNARQSANRSMTLFLYSL
jgi:hypothetical protein